MRSDSHDEYMNFYAPETVHQPVVICIDTSESMGMDTGNGKSKIQTVQELLNSICSVELSEAEKKSVDICVLGFSDTVYTICDWSNLYSFNGDIKLSAGGKTALNSAILQAISKVKEFRKRCWECGIMCRRSQIFVYTDGFSTEPMEEAFEKSIDFFNRQNPSAKLNMVFIPTYYEGKIFKLTDRNNLEDYKQLVKGLGQKVLFINAENCVDGLPASFEFLKKSIVMLSVSAPCESVKVPINKNLLSFIVGHGGAGVDDEGNKFVIDNDIDDIVFIV